MNRLREWWAKRSIRRGLQANKDGWVLTQAGNRNGEGQIIHYVNPFVEAENSVVDLRNIAKLFVHDSNPDAPRKAAENALEAERALDDSYDLGQIAQYGMFIALLVLGYGFGAQSSGAGIAIGI